MWFRLTDDLCDLPNATLSIRDDLAKNRRDRRIYLTPVEVTFLSEQLDARPRGTRLLFPTPTGRQWTRSGFRDRVWAPALRLAAEANPTFDGFTFHKLRHTAGSLMAANGMDPAAAAERLGHTDGGALFFKTYRHLYEEEKRTQAARFGARVAEPLDETWTDSSLVAENGLSSDDRSGRTWD